MLVGIFIYLLSTIAHAQTLVYYANETSTELESTENTKHLIGWLNDMPSVVKAKKVAGQLESDQLVFPKRVKDEVSFLSKAKLRVFVFTNELARTKSFVEKSPTGIFQSRVFPLGFVESNDPIFRLNPLSNPQNFNRVMKWVGNEVRKDELGLIFNSHGTNEFALTPRVSIWTKDWSKERVTKLFQGQSNHRKGISRPFFFSVIRDEISAPVKFVYLQSCGANSIIRRYPLGWKVESFFTGSNGGVPYDTVDYQKVVSDPSPDVLFTFQASLRQNKNLAEFERVSTASLFGERILYFLPLLLVIGIASLRGFLLPSRRHRF